MPSPSDLSGSENIFLSIGKGFSLEASAWMMLPLNIASDGSKRAWRVRCCSGNEVHFVFQPFGKARGFCGFVLAMSPSFDSSFFCSAPLRSRNLSHVSWVSMTEPNTLVASVICPFDPANVSRARSVFSFLTITWHFGAWTKYPYPGLSVFRALVVLYRSDIRPRAFPSSAYHLWITCTFEIFCIRGRIAFPYMHIASGSPCVVPSSDHSVVPFT